MFRYNRVCVNGKISYNRIQTDDNLINFISYWSSYT
jgi:hypothetical protein